MNMSFSSIFFFGKKSKESESNFIFISRIIFCLISGSLAFSLPMHYIAAPSWVPIASFAALWLFRFLINKIKLISNKSTRFFATILLYVVSTGAVLSFFYFVPAVPFAFPFILMAVLPIVLWEICVHFAFFSDAIISSDENKANSEDIKIKWLKILVGFLFFVCFMLFGFGMVFGANTVANFFLTFGIDKFVLPSFSFFLVYRHIITLSTIGAYIGTRLFFYGLGEIKEALITTKKIYKQLLTSAVFFGFFIALTHFYCLSMVIVFPWFLVPVYGVLALVLSYQFPDTLPYNVKSTKINSLINLAVFFTGFLGFGFYGPVPHFSWQFILIASGLIALVINGLVSHNALDDKNGSDMWHCKFGVFCFAALVGIAASPFFAWPVVVMVSSVTAVIFNLAILLFNHGEVSSQKQGRVGGGGTQSVVPQSADSSPGLVQPMKGLNHNCWVCHFKDRKPSSWFVVRFFKEAKDLADNMVSPLYRCDDVAPKV